ncbi:TIR domain-containing protein [Actinoplanes sp. NPDC023801]|uniref:TIR domain-containing protein n=1 Tax=Actinoplanes sp. NPDC023801 TaxID=3154595 RepID=UPI0033E8694C
MPFDGFISYSHAADGRLAPAVQRGLHRLARPWHRRRALWIFRDQTGLAVTPGLWSSIQTAMDGSQYFVLLASPEAANSPWVNKEIEHWVATKSPRRILPVLTDGEWDWDDASGDFTAGSTAVPDALRGVFAEEPLYLDLRWARNDLHLSLRHARFRDSIAQLAAPMHGVSKDELESEDVRQHRRARRLWSAATATLVVLTLVASMTGMMAVRNAGLANASAVEARRQQQIASEQRGSAERATEESLRQQENARQHEERALAAAAETRRQEQLAGEQRELADDAAADAAEQEEIARRHEQQAQQQEELADRSEARARRQETLAREQERLAREAAAEAGRQRDEADRQREEARRQREEAAHQRRIAVNRRLVERARAMIDDDPRKALMLAVAAQRLYDDARTRDQISHLVMSTHYAGSLTDVADVVTFANGMLATADAGGAVSVWDVSRPAQPRRVTRVPTAGSAVKTLATDRDGHTLAVADGKSPAVLWDVRDPARPARIVELTDPAGIVRVSFSPDGRTVATTGLDDNTTLWDVTRGRAPVALTTMAGVRQVAFGPDGRTAVSGGTTAIVWDLTDPAQPAQVSAIPPAKAGGALVFHPKLQVIAVEEDGLVVPWDLRIPAQPKRGFSTEAATGDATLTRMAFSADGTVLGLSDSSGTTRLYSLAIGGISGQATLSSQLGDLSGRDGPIRSMALSRDGKMMITAGERRTATLWNVRGAFAREVVAVMSRPSPADLVGVAFRPDGRTLIGADAPDPGSAVAWDLTDPAHPVQGPAAALNSGRIQLMELSKDGRTLAVGGMDEKVTVLDMTRPSAPAVLATITDDADKVGALRFSPDGRTLAVGRLYGKTMLYDMADRARPARVGELVDRKYMSRVEFSPDGRVLAVASGYNVTLWDVSDRSAPARHAELAMGTSAWAAAFSPDGRTLATGAGWTGESILWDIADIAQPHRLATLPGSDDMVTWIGFSPDGRTLATGGISEARLWEVTDRTTPVLFSTLAHPQLRTRDLAFSPDGRTLAAAGYRHVTLWDYSVPKALSAAPGRHACTITGRGLTRQEWAGYIPELPFQPTC